MLTNCFESRTSRCCPLLTGNVSNPGHVPFGAFALVRRLALKFMRINNMMVLLITLPSSDRCSHCPSLRRSLFWHKAIPYNTKIIDGWQVCTCFSYCRGFAALGFPTNRIRIVVHGKWLLFALVRPHQWLPALDGIITGCMLGNFIRFSRASRHIAAAQLPTAIITGVVIFNSCLSSAVVCGGF